VETIKKDAGRVAGLTLLAGALLWGGCQPPGARQLLKGEQMIRKGDYAAAVAQLEKATRLLPKTAQAWNHLGLAYHGNRQPEPALRAYQKALSLDYKLAAAHYNLGCLYLEQNSLPPAVNELTTYTMLQAGAPDGWVKLGTAHLRARRLDAAEKCFKTALDLNPRRLEALNGLGVVQYQRRRTQEALELFNSALAQNGNYAPALLNAAIVSHQSLNNRPAALQKYRQYLGLRPRAENWEAVDAVARQLDGELNQAPARPALSNLTTQSVTTPSTDTTRVNPPAPRSVANRPPVTATATTAPPAALTSEAAGLSSTSKAAAISRGSSTNLPRVTTPPPTATVASSAAPPKNLETPKPSRAVTNQPPDLEVIRLPDAPMIKPPPDNLSLPPPATRADRMETVSSPTVAAGSDRTKPAKRGFFERLNPFKSKSKPATNSIAITPPPDFSETAQMELAAHSTPAQPTPPSEPRPHRRYTYRTPARPAAGNRAEAERLLLQGVRAQQAGRAAQALALYQAATEADAACFAAQYNRGLAAYELGHWPESLAAYECALALQPDSADARYNFALALKRADYPLDAAEELTKLLRERPNDARAHLSQANLYAQQLNEADLAREHYVKFLQLEPRHPEASRIRFWLATHP
jgi:tetratricopeptide (TPR) repeat protein